MTSTSILLTLTLNLTLTLTTLLPSTLSAPASINVADILIRNDQFTFFLRLINETRILNQLQDQLNNSNQGMTLFAPTDNAFHNLPAGTINTLTEGKKMELVLYHILPKYYTMEDLVTVSNPVPTQLGGAQGSLGLNFTGRANQVHVSTGVVETRINKALRKDFPFAVYAVDQLLIPLEFSADFPAPERSSSSSPPAGAKAPTSPVRKRGANSAKAPSSPAGKTEAMAPSSPAGEPEAMPPSSPEEKPGAMAPSSPGGKAEAMAPSLPPVSPSINGGVRMGIGVGLMVFCMAFL